MRLRGLLFFRHVYNKTISLRHTLKAVNKAAGRSGMKQVADGGMGMKVSIEIEEGLAEEEVVIRCGRLNDTVVGLQNYISTQGDAKKCISLMDGETQYFIPVEKIFFFETQGRDIQAHTADRIFFCAYKLYELEELLPGNFMRVSKSSIVNLDVVYSITRNLTASSVMEFTAGNKKALVSRAYYKAVTERLKARKLGI